MPNICFLCASDEGIFLDISEDKTFFNKIETCLSLKASKDDALSTKICHKCAYEVDKCYDFVHKYKDSRKELEKNPKKRKSNCFFCQEPAKKSYFFNLKKTNQLNDVFEKIYYLFDELSEETDIFICLVCRYSIDLLFDLQTVSEEVSEKLHKVFEEGVGVEKLAKTKTSIVRRKTTRVKSPRIGLQAVSDTESDSSIMARNSRKVSNKTDKKMKNRFCDECQSETDKGVDMFRIHRTGRTVCKNCWVTMDPEKITERNKRKRNSSDADIVSCKVFLKDVLRSSNKQEPKPIRKPMEKRTVGRVTCKITDESSSNESRTSTKTKAQLKEIPEIPNTRLPSSRIRKIPKRNIVDESSDEEEKSKPKRANQPKTAKVDSRPKRGEKVIKKEEKVIQKEEKVIKKEEKVIKKEEKVIKKEVKVVKVKEEEEETPKVQRPTRVRKKPEKIIETIALETPRKRTSSRQKADLKPSQSKRGRSSSAESIASSTRSRSTVSVDVELPKRSTRKRNDSTTSISSTTSLRRTARGATKSLSSKETTPVREFKSPPKVTKPTAKKSKTVIIQPEVKQVFNCAVCNSEFESKDIYDDHKKTHLKNFEIKVERVHYEKKIEEAERLSESDDSSNKDQKSDESEDFVLEVRNGSDMENKITSEDKIEGEENENEKSSRRGKPSRFRGKLFKASKDLTVEKGNNDQINVPEIESQVAEIGESPENEEKEKETETVEEKENDQGEEAEVEKEDNLENQENIESGSKDQQSEDAEQEVPEIESEVQEEQSKIQEEESKVQEEESKVQEEESKVQEEEEEESNVDEESKIQESEIQENESKMDSDLKEIDPEIQECDSNVQEESQIPETQGVEKDETENQQVPEDAEETEPSVEKDETMQEEAESGVETELNEKSSMECSPRSRKRKSPSKVKSVHESSEDKVDESPEEKGPESPLKSGSPSKSESPLKNKSPLKDISPSRSAKSESPKKSKDHPLVEDSEDISNDQMGDGSTKNKSPKDLSPLKDKSPKGKSPLKDKSPKRRYLRDGSPSRADSLEDNTPEDESPKSKSEKSPKGKSPRKSPRKIEFMEEEEEKDKSLGDNSPKGKSPKSARKLSESKNEEKEVSEDVEARSPRDLQDDDENLEDLLQREGLQVIDEVAESVSSADNDEIIDPPEGKSLDIVSHDDLTVAYTTGSSQESLEFPTLHSEDFEAPEKCDPIVESSNNENENCHKEDDETSQEEISQENETKISHENETEISEENETKISEENETKISQEENEGINESSHSTPTRDENKDSLEIENRDLEENDETVEDSRVLETELEDIASCEDFAEINSSIVEDEALENQSLPQEIEDVVQNGLEMSGDIVSNVIESQTNNEEEETKAEDTVTEVLQECFDIATSKQKDEKNVFCSSQANLEDISNDALNGGDMPSLETDESEVSNL